MLKIRVPGVLLVIAVMIIANLLAAIIPYLGTALLSLLLGLIIRQLSFNFEKFIPGISWSEKYALEAAVVLMGLGFNFSTLITAGASTVGIIFISIIIIILIVLLLQKVVKGKDKLLWLLGAGSAICGSSAIGATAPLIRAKEEETGAAMAVINFLGLLGMLILPVIAVFAGYNSLDTGILLGGILQSVGHVAGASFSVSAEIGQLAMIVKMGRIIFLIPFLIFIYLLFRKNIDGTVLKFPLFIIFFLAAVLISQTGIISGNILKIFTKTGDVLLNGAMAAIGLKINIRSLWKISGQALTA
ncbi:MAG: putative sulfate exporter family transporter, partial [Flavobacteriia bacterium]|nr:putative sulfate exporter family transporter [Flavobacteriia bacterium]